MNPSCTKISLRDAARKQTESVELNPEQLDHLLRMQHEAMEKAGSAPKSAISPAHPGAFTQRSRLALVGGFSALVGVMLAMLVQWQGASMGSNPMIARIADEVARNHLALKPMEMTSGSLQDIRGYFKKLDFLPRQTRLLAGFDTRTLGGRYCSIGGGIAVQLRVQEAGGELRTLYQVRHDPKRFGTLPDIGKGKTPARAAARGVAVKVWVENGLLFAMTGD